MECVSSYYFYTYSTDSNLPSLDGIASHHTKIGLIVEGEAAVFFSSWAF